jgi:FkbM family methyltransferase
MKMFKEVKARLFNIYQGNKSYSQCGEDIILDYLIDALKIKNLRYLDIGANDPIIFNNTYLFYCKGYRGVCIEPDPISFHHLQKIRKEDKCFNIGIGIDKEIKYAKFFMMTSSTLNTFSEERANNYVKSECYGKQTIERVANVKLVPINEILRSCFNPWPNLVSLDVEGLEFSILKTIDFTEFRPELFCIETAFYAGNKSLHKTEDIIRFMESNGYYLYADTFINSIFVEDQIWNSYAKPTPS